MKYKFHLSALAYEALLVKMRGAGLKNVAETVRVVVDGEGSRDHWPRALELAKERAEWRRKK